MSHFSVAVFTKPGQTVEELLAPYDENLEVKPYLKYTRQQAINEARKLYPTSTKDMPDDGCWQYLADDYDDDMIGEDGSIYSTYNPKSKWDWWEEGGRWSGMLKSHCVKVNSCQVQDGDFSIDQEQYERSLRFWDVVVDHQPKAETEESFTLYKESYYREYYGDRETYARQQATFTTYAVITPDGEWHAPGDMGWFGCSSENAKQFRDWYDHYQERFIDSAEPDWTITLVDCHI